MHKIAESLLYLPLCCVLANFEKTKLKATSQQSYQSRTASLTFLASTLQSPCYFTPSEKPSERWFIKKKKDVNRTNNAFLCQSLCVSITVYWTDVLKRAD